MDHANIRIVYLGYYLKDWYGNKNAEFSIQRGLKTRKEEPENIGDLWGNGGLDEEFRIMNQYLNHVFLYPTTAELLTNDFCLDLIFIGSKF